MQPCLKETHHRQIVHCTPCGAKVSVLPLHSWGGRPPIGTGLDPPLSIRASRAGATVQMSHRQVTQGAQTSPPGGSWPPMAPLCRWEDGVWGREEPPSEPCCLSRGRFQRCMNQRSRFREREGIMQCQGKVDSLASGRAAGQWAGAGGGGPLGSQAPFPQGRVENAVARCTPEAGRALVWAAAGLLVPRRRYLHCTSGSVLGRWFPGCKWGAQGHPAGRGLSKAPRPPGTASRQPSPALAPGPPALHPLSSCPTPAWWPPRVRGCTGRTAGFPTSQLCVSVAACERRICAQAPGRGHFSDWIRPRRLEQDKYLLPPGACAPGLRQKHTHRDTHTARLAPGGRRRPPLAPSSSGGGRLH